MRRAAYARNPRRTAFASSLVLFSLLLGSATSLGAGIADPQPFAPAAWTTPADSVERVKELRDRSSRDARDVEARRELAEYLGRSSDIEERREASQALTEAVRISPHDGDLWARLARLQERRGFHREARLAYDRALKYAPHDASLWSELAAHELHRFQHYHRDDLLLDAWIYNDRALRTDAGDPLILERAVRIAAIRGNKAKVDSLCTLWRRADPEDPWPVLYHAMLYTEAGAWSRAQEEFQRGISMLPPEGQFIFHTLEVVAPEDWRAMEDVPDSLRYWEDYWGWRDPTPADKVNPRLLEHYRRIAQAQLYFGRDDRPDFFGWDHAPGELIVRYGLPDNWRYQNDVLRGRDRFNSATLKVPTIDMRVGQRRKTTYFMLVDYNLNGKFYHPVGGFARNDDLMLAGMPSDYVEPFPEPKLSQEIELWRFVDTAGDGRIEVVAALPGEEWGDLLDDPHRLASRLALYDESWENRDAAVGSWAQFERDPYGRLIGIFRLQGTRDSVVVGLETRDRRQAARAAGYATLEPEPAGEGPALSHIAFLSGVDFEGAAGRYARAYGSGLPNPGHYYRPGDPIGIGFEAYGLAVGHEGDHRARIHVTVSRRTAKGLLKVLLRIGQSPAEAELAFDVSDRGASLEQLLAIELPPLDPGDYQLEVEVEDLSTGARAGRTEPFRVLHPKENP